MTSLAGELLPTEFAPGKRHMLFGETLSAMMRAINTNRVIAGPGIHIEQSELGTLLDVEAQPEATFFMVAKITGDGEKHGFYTWDQKAWDDNEWVDPPGFQASDKTHGEAYEMNEVRGLPADLFVLLFSLPRSVRKHTTAEGESIIVSQWHFNTPGVGTCVTPDRIGTTAETEAAQTDTIDMANPADGKDGWIDTRLVRMAYDHEGDMKLYAYYREYKYDSLGNLRKISAEAGPITIDAPDDC